MHRRSHAAAVAAARAEPTMAKPLGAAAAMVAAV